MAVEYIPIRRGWVVLICPRCGKAEDAMARSECVARELCCRCICIEEGLMTPDGRWRRPYGDADK